MTTRLAGASRERVAVREELRTSRAALFDLVHLAGNGPLSAVEMTAMVLQVKHRLEALARAEFPPVLLDGSRSWRSSAH
jgi:hypothetical protein